MTKGPMAHGQLGFLPEQVIPMSPYVHWLISIFPIENGQCEGNGRPHFQTHPNSCGWYISGIILYVPIQSCGYIMVKYGYIPFSDTADGISDPT